MPGWETNISHATWCDQKPPNKQFLKIQFKGEKKGDFPGDLVIENLPANAGDMGSLSGPGRLHMLRGI